MKENNQPSNAGQRAFRPLQKCIEAFRNGYYRSMPHETLVEYFRWAMILKSLDDQAYAEDMKNMRQYHEYQINEMKNEIERLNEELNKQRRVSAMQILNAALQTEQTEQTEQK